MTADGLGRGLAGRSYWALVVAQFLDGFNANALRFVVGMIVVEHMGLTGAARVPPLAAVLAVFAMPYILFSTFAGDLADRFSKRTVIIWAKLVELAVVSLSALAFWTLRPWLCVGVVFLMGAQAAFFSPAKYGILPEILEEADLSRGNGLLELFSNLAIILGIAAGGLLMAAFPGRLQHVGLVLAAVAVAGTLASLFIGRLPAADPGRRLRWNFAAEAWANLRTVRGDRALFLSLLGVAYFWLMGALFQLNFTLYGVELLGLDEPRVGLLLAVGGVGIGAGAVLAGWLSADKVEFGLVPAGAAVMAAFSVDLFFAHRSAHPVARTALDVFMLGLGSGVYLVPLLAFVQGRAPREAKGRVLAVTNLLSFLAIIAAAGIFAAVGTRLNPARVYLFLSALTVGVAAYLFTLLPDFLRRLWAALKGGARPSRSNGDPCTVLSRFSKIGGEMVPHGRVEEAIEAILGGDELRVAVAGVPDEKKGERLVVLHTRLPLGVEELWRRLNASELPKLWLPRREDFHEVAELPLLGTGKLDLRAVRKLAAELAGG